MGAFFQRKSVRVFLAAFKWCRVAALLIVLLAVAALACLQWAGLPDFLKEPLLRTLRQRGLDAQFASARLGWGPSIIIENAAFSPTNQSSGPRLSAAKTQLVLNGAALLHARLQVDSFEVQQAGLSLPVSPTNQAPLSLTDVNLLVTLSSNNLALLTNGSAWCRGIRLHVNGDLRNFLSMRDWTLPLPSVAAAPPATGQTNLAPAAPRLTAWEILQSIRFTGTPDLNLHFSADGQDRNTLRAELAFTAAGAQTAWGHSGPLRLSATCARLLNSGQAPFFQALLLASEVTTPWAACRGLSADIAFSREAQTNLSVLADLTSREVRADWPASSGSNWVRVSDLRWVGTTTLPSPAFRPATFQGKLSATRTESGWGSVDAASLIVQSRRTDDSSPPDPSWGLWNKIKTFTLDWQAEATNLVTPKLKLNHVAFNGGWHAPQLTIDTLQAVMDRGHLEAGGSLDVASREAQARAAVDFDPHQISLLLTGPAQHWISLYDWETPPRFSAGLRCVLPPWTNRLDDWPEDSRNSLQLAGDFSVGRGAFRGIAVTSAQSHYTYTNHVWNVSGLRVAGQRGALDLDYQWNEATDDYHFRFDSKLDPAVALPLLTEAQQRALREASFSEKPEIHGDVWGHWGAPETTGFAATLAAQRFVVRGESVDQLNAQLDYTNRCLRLSRLNLAHEAGRVEVPLASIDFASNVYSMTNASSTVDPEAVRRALGKIAPSWMRELQFDAPPQVQASGSFTPGDDNGTDLRFVVHGGRFHWNHLTTDSVQGEVYYHVRTVEVTNVQASLYKTGKLQSGFTIDWGRQGTRFRSEASLHDIDLAALAQELTKKSSKLEGMLDGHLALGAPFNASDTNLFGSGALHVHNGLLWDIKLFGALSPMLNAIAPGSGESRAREAKASFIITNGVLFTDDLEIRSSGFRLLYRGSIDTKTRLNARVEANLLRDEPVFGHFLGWMLTPLGKIFEYRVTGTLSKPITKPLYIPKILLEILRPFHSLKEMAAPKPAPAKPPPPSPVTPQN
jgi:hypothetical protein